MSCGSLSPSAATAMSGMLQGQGLSVPPALATSVTAFTSTGIVGAAQNTMAASAGVLGNPLAGLGANILPALTGVVPTALLPMMASGNLNNFAGQVLNQATRTMAGGIGGFAQIFSQAQGFAMNSLSAKSFMATANNITFSKLGLGINNISGLASNGFGAISGDMAKFSSVIGTLGSLYNTRNIAGLGTPGNMMKNLLDRNLGSIGNLVGKLEDRQIPLDDVENPKYAAQVKQVLGEVEVADVKTIYGTLKVNLPSSTNLTDALDINKLDTAANVSAITADVRSLPALGKRFSEMGATFDSTKELADLSRSMELVSVPRLDAHTGERLVAGTDRNTIDSQLGMGSGPYNNPNIEDLLGSVAGVTHVDSLDKMASPLANIKATSHGVLFDAQMRLMQDVANGVYEGGGNAMLDQAEPARYANIVIVDAGNLANAGMSSLTITGNITQTLTEMRAYAELTLANIKNDPTLSKDINTVTYNYQESTEQLAKEKYNLAAAGVDLLLPSGATSTGAMTDTSYPNAPLTDWSADDLFRYWLSLPAVNTGKVSFLPMSTAIIENPDLCRGAMYITASQFTNNAGFISQITSHFDGGSDNFFPTANTAIWSRSYYPEVGNVTFDFATGICHYSEKEWRTVGLTEDRPVGYPINGIPRGASITSDPSDINPPPQQPPGASGSASGDKNSIINLASQLSDIGKDTKGLGLSNLISNMATNDVYGDAIKVAMIEGRNQARLQSIGIIPIANKIIGSE